MDIMKMMKQAQQLQSKMQEMQAEMEQTSVSGQAGGGMVSVTLTAKGDMKGVSIDPSLLRPEDREMVEDLILAAHADARRKAEGLMAEKMQAMTGGMQLPPGFKMPF